MIDAELWLLRLLWLVAPFAAGPVFADAVDGAERPFRIGVAVGSWVIWAAMLIALMVPRTQTLTAIRIVVPGALGLFVWAAIAAGDATDAVVAAIGGAVLAAATVLVLRAPVADRFVDGSSYGDERRFLLRTPGPLLVGPLALAWALTVAGLVAGPLLLLAERWVLGVLAVVVGAPLAWFGVGAIHRLSDRWLVFVPAGVVVHDRTALREPQLFRVADVAAFGPAPIDADEEDLTLSSPGLALRVKLTGSSKIAPNRRSDTVELVDIDGFLVMPNRPGAAVAEATERGFTIG